MSATFLRFLTFFLFSSQRLLHLCYDRPQTDGDHLSAPSQHPTPIETAKNWFERERHFCKSHQRCRKRNAFFQLKERSVLL